MRVTREDFGLKIPCPKAKPAEDQVLSEEVVFLVGLVALPVQVRGVSEGGTGKN